MEFHYMDGGPFETIHATVAPCTVVGFQPGTEKFLALSPTGGTFWGTAARLDPPPPIPAAAARKPQVGEVWMVQSGDAIEPKLIRRNTSAGVGLITARGALGFRNVGDLRRPATPAEAEPFRPILDGLKRSLGEA